MLVIPASVLVDWLVHRYILPWPAILGVVIILAGFFALVFSEGFEVFYSRQHKSPTHLAPDHRPKVSKWKRVFNRDRLIRILIF